MNDRGIRRTFPLCSNFEFLVQTPIFTKIVRAIYMYIARHEDFGCLLVEKSFLSKIKDMNDRVIRRTFPLFNF